MNEITIKLRLVELKGNLIIPQKARGLVLFAHGSGSGRMSPRNNYVAQVLQKNNLATLLLDLLTQEEELIDNTTREFRFDIKLLAQRLVEVVQWLQGNSSTKKLLISLFGASTGAAAALIAAAQLADEIVAVVSRGGRPDLAMDSLAKVKAPTLLVVGGEDTEVIQMNEQALKRLTCEKQIEIIDGATHLFEEPGALEEFAKLAAQWFALYLNK